MHNVLKHEAVSAMFPIRISKKPLLKMDGYARLMMTIRIQLE